MFMAWLSYQTEGCQAQFNIGKTDTSDIFMETLGHLQLCLWWQKKKKIQIFFKRSRDIASCLMLENSMWSTFNWCPTAHFYRKRASQLYFVQVYYDLVSIVSGFISRVQFVYGGYPNCSLKNLPLQHQTWTFIDESVSKVSKWLHINRAASSPWTLA